MTALLSLDDIHFAYMPSSCPLLNGASLKIDAGDRLGLHGSNGTGKSTLFHICTGLLIPQKGTIHFLGARLENERDFQKARLGMGYLLQRSQDQLFCATVLEDAAFGPLNQGYTLNQARGQAEAVLEQLGITHLAQRPGCNLSGGEQKLAALATILAMQPKLLLLDEPTNDLDEISQARLEAFLLHTPIPFLLVSHDKSLLTRVTSRQYLLQKGQILPSPAGYVI